MTFHGDRAWEAAQVRPLPRQVAWQDTEFYAFFHVGMNTVTNREWGLGHEDPALFDLPQLDARQWVSAVQAAGMRGVILTAKHHDGFCLWPTSTTRHSVASSPWRDGHGDLVREVSDAARSVGLKVGLYLSPWDRTEPTYGSGAPYDDYFVAQLTELCTNYGELFSVWLDGACGEGPNGRRQVYDWDRYYATVRRWQPDACLSVCGPDVRWCGNEAGHTRVNEWSVVPASLRDAERIQERSQQSDDGTFSRQLLRSDDEDLGSREALARTTEPLVWYPAEVNTSIRPGWFYHPNEDTHVRSAEELYRLWRASVGGNATFLLNIPPDPRGLIADPDIAALTGVGRLIQHLHGRDIAALATVVASSGPVPPTLVLGPSDATPDNSADGSVDGSVDEAWRPRPEDIGPTLTLRWDEPRPIDGVGLRERIEDGQVVEQIDVHGVLAGQDLGVLVQLGAVGHLALAEFPSSLVDTITLTVTRARGPVSLSRICVYAADAATEDAMAH